MAYNDEGLIVNTVGRAFHFDLQAGEYQRLIAAGGAVLAHLALDLPASGVTLRIVVYDPASAKTGSLEVPVEGKLETGNSQTGKSAIDNSAAPLAILPEKEFIFRRSKPESI